MPRRRWWQKQERAAAETPPPPAAAEATAEEPVQRSPGAPPDLAAAAPARARANIQVEPEFAAGYVERVTADAQSPVLGRQAGMPGTARVVSDALETSARIEQNPLVRRLVQREAAETASDPNFAFSLPSFLSFADPEALIAGEYSDSPFAGQLNPASGLELRHGAQPARPSGNNAPVRRRAEGTWGAREPSPRQPVQRSTEGARAGQDAPPREDRAGSGEPHLPAAVSDRSRAFERMLTQTQSGRSMLEEDQAQVARTAAPAPPTPLPRPNAPEPEVFPPRPRVSRSPEPAPLQPDDVGEAAIEPQAGPVPAPAPPVARAEGDIAATGALPGAVQRVPDAAGRDSLPLVTPTPASSGPAPGPEGGDEPGQAVLPAPPDRGPAPAGHGAVPPAGPAPSLQREPASEVQPPPAPVGPPGEAGPLAAVAGITSGTSPSDPGRDAGAHAAVDPGTHPAAIQRSPDGDPDADLPLATGAPLASGPSAASPPALQMASASEAGAGVDYARSAAGDRPPEAQPLAPAESAAAIGEGLASPSPARAPSEPHRSEPAPVVLRSPDAGTPAPDLPLVAPANAVGDGVPPRPGGGVRAAGGGGGAEVGRLADETILTGPPAAANAPGAGPLQRVPDEAPADERSVAALPQPDGAAPRATAGSHGDAPELPLVAPAAGPLQRVPDDAPADERSVAALPQAESASPGATAGSHGDAPELPLVAPAAGPLQRVPDDAPADERSVAALPQPESTAPGATADAPVHAPELPLVAPAAGPLQRVPDDAPADERSVAALPQAESASPGATAGSHAHAPELPLVAPAGGPLQRVPDEAPGDERAVAALPQPESAPSGATAGSQSDAPELPLVAPAGGPLQRVPDDAPGHERAVAALPRPEGAAPGATAGSPGTAPELPLVAPAAGPLQRVPDGAPADERAVAALPQPEGAAASETAGSHAHAPELPLVAPAAAPLQRTVEAAAGATPTLPAEAKGGADGPGSLPGTGGVSGLRGIADLVDGRDMPGDAPARQADAATDPVAPGPLPLATGSQPTEAGPNLAFSQGHPSAADVPSGGDAGRPGAAASPRSAASPTLANLPPGGIARQAERPARAAVELERPGHASLASADLPLAAPAAPARGALSRLAERLLRRRPDTSSQPAPRPVAERGASAMSGAGSATGEVQRASTGGSAATAVPPSAGRQAGDLAALELATPTAAGPAAGTLQRTPGQAAPQAGAGAGVDSPEPGAPGGAGLIDRLPLTSEDRTGGEGSADARGTAGLGAPSPPGASPGESGASGRWPLQLPRTPEPWPGRGGMDAAVQRVPVETLPRAGRERAVEGMPRQATSAGLAPAPAASPATEGGRVQRWNDAPGDETASAMSGLEWLTTAGEGARDSGQWRPEPVPLTHPGDADGGTARPGHPFQRLPVTPAVQRVSAAANAEGPTSEAPAPAAREGGGLPVVAPAAIQRTPGMAEASLSTLPAGEASGRISRLIPEAPPDAPPAARENSEDEREKELERITEHVYRAIRRKLLVERERTRGRV